MSADRQPAALPDARGRSPRFALVAIDIDDTLVGPDGVISAANAAAISRFIADGARVVLASGRSHANILPFHQALGLPPGPIISSQGAVVQDSATGDVRFSRAMSPKDVATVTRDGRARGFAVQHYRPSGIYVEMQTEWTEYDQSRNAEVHRHVHDLLDGAERDATPHDVAKIIWLGDPDTVTSITAEAHAAYDEALTVTRTDPPYLEFSALNVDKSTALARVAEEMNVPRERVLAFGDGNNDAAMLSWAGLGVAMPHAKPAARAAADWTGPDGDPETALARAIAMVLDERIPD